MDIKINKYRNIYILMMFGELDLYNAPRLEKAFLALKEKGINYFVIDFEKISYIDSSGVGTLLKLKNISENSGLVFLLSSIKGEVLNVLELTNLLQFFSVTENYKTGIRKILEIQGKNYQERD